MDTRHPVCGPSLIAKLLKNNYLYCSEKCLSQTSVALSLNYSAARLAAFKNGSSQSHMYLTHVRLPQSHMYLIHVPALSSAITIHALSSAKHYVHALSSAEIIGALSSAAFMPSALSSATFIRALSSAFIFSALSSATPSNHPRLHFTSPFFFVTSSLDDEELSSFSNSATRAFSFSIFSSSCSFVARSCFISSLKSQLDFRTDLYFSVI